MITVLPLSAFKDNYIWLLINNETRDCVAVDPGDAEPLLQYIKKNNLRLREVLITHHHHDHSGGIHQLLKHIPDLKIYGPAREPLQGNYNKVDEKTLLKLSVGNFSVLEIPGHTLGHVAYFGNGMLFCGDTLFSAGCGRVFEGTYEQMFESLQKISRLPLDTAIYCGHEYTQNNLRFAALAEPDNVDVKKYLTRVEDLRKHHHPTLPSTLELEKKVNPFLRCKDVSDFQRLREWKDGF